MSLLTIQDYEQLQFETLSTRLQRKTTKMMVNRNCKRAADKASTKGPTKCKEDPWTAKLTTRLHCTQLTLTIMRRTTTNLWTQKDIWSVRIPLVTITLTLCQYILLRGDKRRMLTTFWIMMILSVILITKNHLEQRISTTSFLQVMIHWMSQCSP